MQQLPFKIRGMVSAVDFKDTVAIARTLRQIDSSQEDTASQEKIKEWRPHNSNNGNIAQNRVNSLQWTNQLSEFQQPGNNIYKKPYINNENNENYMSMNQRPNESKNFDNHNVFQCSVMNRISGPSTQSCFRFPDVRNPPANIPVADEYNRYNSEGSMNDQSHSQYNNLN